MNLEQTAVRLQLWLQERVSAAGASGVVLGLSGGIDSAVVAALAKRAFGERMLTVIMPCHSDPEDAADARLVAEALQVPVTTVDLAGVYDSFLGAVQPWAEAAPLMAKVNVKPRLRMITLYFFAAVHNYLVVGTGNKDELTIGYFTKYGDGGVDLLPLGNLVKSQVRELARYLGVPDKIISKPPSAGLWTGQRDEEEMGFGYDVLDAYLLGRSVSPQAKERIESLRRRSQHKRELAPVGPEPVLAD